MRSTLKKKIMRVNRNYIIFLGFLFTLTSFAQDSKVLELATCKQLALDNNRRITKAKRQVDAANQGIKAAKLSAYPMLDASGVWCLFRRSFRRSHEWPDT